MSSARAAQPGNAARSKRGVRVGILAAPPGVDRSRRRLDRVGAVGERVGAVGRVRVDERGPAAPPKSVRAGRRAGRAAAARTRARAQRRARPARAATKARRATAPRSVDEVQSRRRAARCGGAEVEPVLGAAESRRRMFARCRTITPPIAASAPNTTTGHGSPNAPRATGSAHRRDHRGERRVAEHEEDDEPDGGAGERRRAARRRRTRRRRSRPSSRPSRSAGTAAASGRASRRRRRATPARCDDELRRRANAGTKPFSDVEQDDRHAEPAAVRAPDVRGADVAAADRADVHVLEQRGTTQ